MYKTHQLFWHSILSKMLEKEMVMESAHENGSNCISKSKSRVVAPWSFETNWIIAHGSLEDSVTIESDYPITESDMDDSALKSPLVLKRRRLDSGPCEIKICFGKKYDIGQIYVRSTALAYEIYYANSPHSNNEYLCTVRCGAAERDEKILQTTGIEYVAKEHGDCFVGELTEDSDDDWVKIQVPEIGRSSLSDKTNISRVKNVQDLYEATAQISNADPCSFLVIKFLSLQDKGHAYIDEVYVYANLVESTDSGNEAVMAGSLTGSSLMAMLIPTLMQSVKSGGSRVQNNHASDEVLKDHKMEVGLRTIDVGSAKNQGEQQYINFLGATELQQPISSPNTKKFVEPIRKFNGIDVGSEENQVDLRSMKLQELNQDTTELAELQQPTSALNKEHININDILSGRLERALEQLISRVSSVEDICLRLEEKMLKPMERMDSRLQQLEHQLEKLTTKSNCSGLLHCTRISAPAFSCSESNPSSFCNEGIDYPTVGASELENKNTSCNCTPKLFHDARFRPSLVVRAPEFSCGEDEESNDDLESLDTPCIKPKNTLSADDAIAEAVSGFMTTTKFNPSEYIQTISGSSSEVDEKTLHREYAESCQMKSQEFSAAENNSRESSQFSQILSIMAPGFTEEEIGKEEHLDNTQSSSDMDFAFKNTEKDHGDEMISPYTQSQNLSTSLDSCDFNGNEYMRDFGSASNGSFPAVSGTLGRTCMVNLDLSDMREIFGLNTVDSSFEGDTSCSCLEARDLVETENCQTCDEPNPRETYTAILDDKEIAISQVIGLDYGCVIPENCLAFERCLKDDTPNISASLHASVLDFEFPILEVEFTSDDYTSAKAPLEALLDGVGESNIEASDSANDDGNAEQINVVIVDPNETANFSPSKYFLVDLEVSSAEGSSKLESGHNLCSPISPEITALCHCHSTINYCRHTQHLHVIIPIQNDSTPCQSFQLESIAVQKLVTRFAFRNIICSTRLSPMLHRALDNYYLFPFS